ncbi:hypothetical protein [Streptomyces sp. CT34]|uniref:hypothetical protein n=1 Tax=Streptomyces sp. CT34 TaxID=1553907 RepID=UPI001F526656|nr:hypothetical protein [Streptomyces sp. CT34]
MLTIDQLNPGAVPGWAKYPAAVEWTLRRAGHPVGDADLAIDSTVPTRGPFLLDGLECALTFRLLRPIRRHPPRATADIPHVCDTVGPLQSNVHEAAKVAAWPWKGTMG